MRSGQKPLPSARHSLPQHPRALLALAAKPFDELIDIVDSLTSKLRRGKNPRERKSARPVEASKSKAAAAAATTGDQTKEEEKNSSNPAGMILQGENDHNLLVQTVTRHLEDLRDDSP
ncbi:uncharacterized protein LOC127789243 isoform X2 [Diospyros lotus]|uniref:uncharacterized protein LOC127789243 isoform X2 n=1 Tax=Diospyros lotus TaxID=55363 RepID=UPI00224EF7F4|nr:uncharacterized protein LOC127789243 isoform X2 [Diospyros lotus]